MKSIIFVFVALAACWYVDADPVCTANVDVGFIIDSSGSIKYMYQKEKNFVKSLAQAFGIKKGTAHAGVVTFSNVARLSIPFNRYFNVEKFNGAVDGIRHMNSITRIDLALNVARNQLFNPKFGARPNVPKTLVLITDGVHTKRIRVRIGRRRWRYVRTPSPVPIAKAMQKAGINIIVVGVGGKNTINKKELKTYSKHVYTATNFKHLLSRKFIDVVTNHMCSQQFVHECDTKKKGGCSQLCEKVGKKFKCLCEIGYTLDKDGSSCFPTHMELCQHGKALVKVGCFYQLVAPLCKEKEMITYRDLWKGKWKPAPVAKKVAEEIVCKCSALAVKNGHQYFSIRDAGECLTGSPDEPTRLKLSYSNPQLHANADKCYSGDGDFEPCDDASPNMCIGGAGHDYVYIIQDHCSVNNGECSHHCEDVPFGVVCSCRYRYKLLPDKKTCKRTTYKGGAVVIAGK